MKTILIVEDNQSKVDAYIANEGWQLDNLLIVRTAALATEILGRINCKFTLVLDGELASGFGMDVLKALSPLTTPKIEQVYLISYSRSMNKEMYDYCRTFNIPCKRLS